MLQAQEWHFRPARLLMSGATIGVSTVSYRDSMRHWLIILRCRLSSGPSFAALVAFSNQRSAKLQSLGTPKPPA